MSPPGIRVSAGDAIRDPPVTEKVQLPGDPVQSLRIAPNAML
jgi:hypothetical protein